MTWGARVGFSGGWYNSELNEFSVREIGYAFTIIHTLGPGFPGATLGLMKSVPLFKATGLQSCGAA
jgi:hypothetical protein